MEKDIKLAANDFFQQQFPQGRCIMLFFWKVVGMSGNHASVHMSAHVNVHLEVQDWPYRKDMFRCQPADKTILSGFIEGE